MRKSILILCALIGLNAVADSENAQVQSFLGYASSMMVRRPLTMSETKQIATQGRAAINPIVSAWSTEPAFADGAKGFVDQLFHVGGTNANINYDLPGNLAKAIAAKKRPFAELLTSNTCYDPNGNPIACDTGAPFTAGIFTTRAFLDSWNGAYNIRRAGKIIFYILCQSLPMPEDVEPKVKASELIAEFATSDGKVQFGNGGNCYACHGQFSRHAQLFVKFDKTGKYFGGATGLGNPNAVAPGFSTNNTFTSHFSNPTTAASERSEILKRPAANLAEAAVVYTQRPEFLQCGVKNLMKYYLRIDGEIEKIKPDLFRNIADRARSRNPNPGFGDLALEIALDPTVFNSFIKSGARP